ncbi:DUF445 domain-containing protein [Paenibacillus sp. NFR01]|uniref:DUF445 domain-containing protein n=1 Tax=Paenibacillus sp. NFR01 TaxID=1566279 RepID=UPI0008BEA933|nr:DUF445 domain-containing protein [Paenibacillus sp. NFR01]SEU23706.1 Uncharacterized membrane-anchored protein YjiN, DUF445 family [Paenibacillus sp. NFR01]
MRSRHLASISLAVMACGFLITLFLPENTAVILLRGGFEAGLVGGIADWFAVTALFRHPLGLPIPHTSLLLKNRDKIVQSLISAMETELLNPASIGNKLREFRFVSIGSGLLTRFFARRKGRLQLLAQLETLIGKLPLEQAVPYIQKAAADYVRSADVGGTAEKIVTRLIQDGKDLEALDYALEGVAGWSARPETKMMLGNIAAQKLSEVKLGGLKGMAFQAFVGFMDADMLGDMLQGMLKSAIEDFREADNPHREEIMREIRIAIFQLVGDESKMAMLKDWALGAIQGEEAADFLLKELERLRGKILERVQQDRAAGGRKLFELYVRLTRRISIEQEWLGLLEERIRNSLVDYATRNHYRIGLLVKENLDKMDDASLVSMLEEKIGKDLQWIRVNGAVCGFIVGLVLTVIQMF